MEARWARSELAEETRVVVSRRRRGDAATGWRRDGQERTTKGRRQSSLGRRDPYIDLERRDPCMLTS